MLPIHTFQHLLAVLLFSLCSPTTATFSKSQLPQSLQDCLSQTSADIVYPSSPDYNTTAQSQNTNYHYKPAAIALPTSTSEVAAVVKCVASQDNTKISTYGGGHGYASYALGGSDGYVMIDSQKMQDLEINGSDKEAKVGMGMRVGPFSTAIGAKGFALPHGTCSSIGLFGHALGGGWGFNSRNWGWTMDHIVEIEYVDAQGCVQTIAEGKGDQDVWWAMRGAGANNFGVVTHTTLSLVPAPPRSLNWRTVLNKNQECGAALLTIQYLGMKEGALPNELGIQLLLYGERTESNPGACALSGQYFGSEDEFRQVETIIQSGLEERGVEGYKKANVSEFDDWVDTLTNLQGNLTAPPNVVPYYAQSLMDSSTPAYTNASIQSILAAIQNTVNISGTSTSLSFDLDGPGSMTNTKQDSAFAVAGKRNALFLSQIYNYGTPGFDEAGEREKVLEVVDRVRDAVKGAGNGTYGAYVNYIDPRLEDWAVEYYGDALGRLKGIKGRVDPGNLFDFPQGLGRA